MSSSALETQGTKIRVEISTVLTAIGEIASFDGPSGSAAVIDVSDMDSTGKEKRMGLPDEGQLSLTVWLKPSDTVHKYLRTARSNRTEETFQIEFTDGTTTNTLWDFNGFVTGFAASGAVDAVIEGSITIEITGSITQTDAT